MSRSPEFLYFFWLCEQVEVVIDDKSTGSSCCPMYEKLFNYLYYRDFIWSIRNDENRAEDGIALRDEFEKETGYILEMDPSCSVLEMLIGLAKRCRNDIMDQSGYENSTYFWFWAMIKNCKLDIYDDLDYNKYEVDQIVDRILDRNYRKNGVGGLFPIESIDIDLRKVELWYQLNYWLEYNFDVMSDKNNYIL